MLNISPLVIKPSLSKSYNLKAPSKQRCNMTKRHYCVMHALCELPFVWALKRQIINIFVPTACVE